MTRTELIERLAEKMPNLSAQMIDQLVKEVFDHISTTLTAGNRVEVRDFGIFFVTERSARIARNPKTGEKVKTKRRTIPRFKAGKELKERVNAALLNAVEKGSKS